ncbi:MAG: hypothetical protein WBY93_01865 [Candidatus Binatus sp.]
MRHIFALAALFTAVALFGCSTQQPDQTQAEPQTASAPQSQSQLVIAPQVIYQPAHPLPFKGKLLSGDPAELPPAVVMSLSNSSPVTFTYREELTHDDYHIPLVVTALDPATLIGAPLGDIGTTAFASLSISAGDTIIGDYTAKEHASKSYSMYTNASHKEVDDAALAAVRQRIDQKLYQDEARLAQAAATAGKSPTASAGQ